MRQLDSIWIYKKKAKIQPISSLIFEIEILGVLPLKKELILFLFIASLLCSYLIISRIREKKEATEIELSLHHPYEVLCGKDLESWNYIHSDKDWQKLESYSMLYQKHFENQFDANPTFKIPKTIHLIWLGPKPFPSSSVAIIRSWMAYHPDWTFVFWTDRIRPAPCRGMKVSLIKEFPFEFLEKKFMESTNWGEKSDLLRYEILYKYGGIYIDHDAKCLRPFHGLNRGYDFYACLEFPHEGIEDHALTVGNALIGSKPRHPILRETIQAVLDRWDQVTEMFSSQDAFAEVRRVAYRSYIALTLGAQKGVNRPENIDIIFPSLYFFPKYQMTGFYSEHLYGTTWHSLAESPAQKKFQRPLNALKRRASKIIRLEMISLFALIGSFALYFLILRELKRRHGN